MYKYPSCLKAEENKRKRKNTSKPRAETKGEGRVKEIRAIKKNKLVKEIHNKTLPRKMNELLQSASEGDGAATEDCKLKG